MNNLESLEQRLGVQFKNKDMLLQAVVHRSYLNENPDFRLGHNERLEFLGDAVIELSVTRYLFDQYPDSPEGDLTNWRASLVNAKTLSELARELDVDEYLYLSKGESQDRQSKARQYILANAYESIVGAMYLDCGYDATDAFLKRNLLVRLPYILEHKLYLDPKSRFQEAAQEIASMTPSYQVISEVGPDHEKIFRVGVLLGDEQIAIGEGLSKQEAQIQAAERALEVKGW